MDLRVVNRGGMETLKMELWRDNKICQHIYLVREVHIHLKIGFSTEDFEYYLCQLEMMIVRIEDMFSEQIRGPKKKIKLEM